MMVSTFELFKIGIGPSSSHTVGPMIAAREFLFVLKESGKFDQTNQVVTRLYGSLALTGIGHGTNRAILLGLMGETPDGVDPDSIAEKLAAVRHEHSISLLGEKPIPFDEDMNLLYLRNEVLPRHSNGMQFSALDENEDVLLEETFYSIGGGFIVRGDEEESAGDDTGHELPYSFGSAAELLDKCRVYELRIHELVMENEKTWRSEKEIRTKLLNIWQAMQQCVARGMREEGILPGGLNVQRRAPKLHRDLISQSKHNPLDILDWVNMFALAVNEENAAGGRVVTAPTNGAAGIIPAVMHYYQKFHENSDDEGIIRFLLTASAIGALYKKNAGISGAEMGCQGEVGVACSMAAAGLVAASNGSNEQVENAAEIGMEHNLGLTCDPIKGLVQIPCIERNAMGSLKAINAARMALRGDGKHKVSLDQVIATMRQTGRDMQSIYKETSLGGLAVNVPEC